MSPHGHFLWLNLYYKSKFQSASNKFNQNAFGSYNTKKFGEKKLA